MRRFSLIPPLLISLSLFGQPAPGNGPFPVPVATQIGGTNTIVQLTNMDNPTFLAVAKGLVSGSTFSNVNRYGWANWYSRYRLAQGNTSTQQIAIAAVTDGLGTDGLLTATAQSGTNWGLPIIGYQNGVFPVWVGFVGGTAVQGSEHDGVWYNTYFILPNQNDSVTFSNFNSGGPNANAATFYYLTETNAGHIKIETNWGGTFGVANASIDIGGTVLGEGQFSVTNLALGPTILRVTQLDAGGKTARILYPKVWNTFSNGIIFLSMQGSGSDIPGNILTTNLGFSGKVWADLNPALIIDSRVTTTDDGGATIGATYTNLNSWYRFLKTNFVSTDVVIATPWANGDTSGINSLGNNIERTNAQYWGFGFFDGWNALGSASNVYVRGWVSTPGNVHGTASGITAYESVLQHWLDLYTYGGPISGQLEYGTVVNTNLISGQIYTNTYPTPLTITATITNVQASVAGTTRFELWCYNPAGATTKGFTNGCGSGTISGSLAVTNSLLLSGQIPPGFAYTLTNRVGGAGNAANPQFSQAVLQ